MLTVPNLFHPRIINLNQMWQSHSYCQLLVKEWQATQFWQWDKQQSLLKKVPSLISLGNILKCKHFVLGQQFIQSILSQLKSDFCYLEQKCLVTNTVINSSFPILDIFSSGKSSWHIQNLPCSQWFLINTQWLSVPYLAPKYIKYNLFGNSDY